MAPEEIWSDFWSVGSLNGEFLCHPYTFCLLFILRIFTCGESNLRPETQHWSALGIHRIFRPFFIQYLLSGRIQNMIP